MNRRSLTLIELLICMVPLAACRAEPEPFATPPPSTFSPVPIWADTDGDPPQIGDPFGELEAECRVLCPGFVAVREGDPVCLFVALQHFFANASPGTSARCEYAGMIYRQECAECQ